MYMYMTTRKHINIVSINDDIDTKVVFVLLWSLFCCGLCFVVVFVLPKQTRWTHVRFKFSDLKVSQQPDITSKTNWLLRLCLEQRMVLRAEFYCKSIKYLQNINIQITIIYLISQCLIYGGIWLPLQNLISFANMFV